MPNGFYFQLGKGSKENLTTIAYGIYPEIGKPPVFSHARFKEIPPEVFQDVIEAATHGYDSFMDSLKSLETGNNRMQGYIKYCIENIEGAIERQQSDIFYLTLKPLFSL